MEAEFAAATGSKAENSTDAAREAAKLRSSLASAKEKLAAVEKQVRVASALAQGLRA